MKVSIVSPVFNESKGLEAFVNAIQNALKEYDYECLLVDDGSTDTSFEIIKQLSLSDPKIKGISLSRNFGHQVALFAGIKEACGDIVITMDSDLQHPPEVILKLIAEYKKGFDIVNTKRSDHKNTGLSKKLSSKWYYRILNSLSDTKIESGSSDFRLMSLLAKNAFLEIPEKDRFNRGLISWMGFKQTVVAFDAPARKTGRSKFTYKKMQKLGIDGILSFSVKPLKVILNIGIFSTLLGLAYLTYVLIQHFSNNTVQGWTSTMIVLLMLGGFQLISLGIIGQYIARIYNESKNRPMYFIKDRC